MLRSKAKRVSKTVKELDAFPKVPESYVETSPVGGTCMHLVRDKVYIKILAPVKQLQRKVICVM
jgi:hypothetical protein